MTSQEAFDTLCNWVNVEITGNSADNSSIKNLLGVLPYQFEPEFDSDDRVGGLTYESTSYHNLFNYINKIYGH